MTHDSDFGSLAINKGVPCYGIIYLKLKMFKIDYLVSIFDRFLSLDIEINPFSLVVIDESRIRIRLIEHLQNLN